MAQFSIESLSKIEEAGNKFKSLSDEYTKIYNELVTTATSLGEAYQGTDNDKFVEKITEFSEKLKAMAGKLKNGGETLILIKKNYKDAQGGNLGTAGKLPT